MRLREGIIVIGLSGALATHAAAADLPNPKAPPVFEPPVAEPVSPATWTGCFVGGAGSVDIGHLDNRRLEGIAAANGAASRTTLFSRTTQRLPIAPGLIGRKGITTTIFRRSSIVTRAGVNGLAGTSYGRTFVDGSGFGRIGCDRQIGRFVLGAQLEGGYLGLKTNVSDPSRAVAASGLGGGPYGAISGRLGYVLTARTLLFVRGGVGYADIRYSSVDSVFGYASSARGSDAIPLVGAGIEYRLTPRIGITSEYTYLHLGCRTTGATFPALARTMTGPAADVTGFASTRSCVDDHRIALGLNYHFNATATYAGLY